MTGYYGRPILKRPVWKHDIPAYFFAGGVMAGSSLLAAGADMAHNHPLRRAGRVAALAGLGVSTGLLIHDLGRPGRFANMLRVVKPTSPMSIGTWILAAYGGPVTLAAGSELAGFAPRAGRAAGLAAAAVAPAIATYTAVLTSDTAIPAWHDAHRHLPFVYAGSAGAASGGLMMTVVGLPHARPARRSAVFGAALELAASTAMERSMGLSGKPYREGKAGRLNRWARSLTAAGAVGTVVAGGRSRVAAALCGAALLAGSACTRFSVFHAGMQSAEDPRYVIGARPSGDAVLAGVDVHPVAP